MLAKHAGARTRHHAAALARGARGATSRAQRGCARMADDAVRRRRSSSTTTAPPSSTSSASRCGRSTYANWHLIVVDSASATDRWTRSSARSRTRRLRRCDENVGFAAGANIGIAQLRRARLRLRLFLNNDATVTPDFLRALVDAADDRRIVVPKILYCHDRRLISTHAGGFDWRLGLFRDTFAGRPTAPATIAPPRRPRDGELLLRARARTGVPRRRTARRALLHVLRGDGLHPPRAGKGLPRALRARRRDLPPRERLERRRLDDAVQAVLRHAQPHLPRAQARDVARSVRATSPPTSGRRGSPRRAASHVAHASGVCCARCGSARSTTTAGAWGGRCRCRDL